MMDEQSTDFEDIMLKLNESQHMNLRIERTVDEPYKDFKQFVRYLIRKVQIISFHFSLMQIYVITNQIDLEKAPADLLENAQQLKELYSQGILNTEEYSERRLQILDKMFMREKGLDKTHKIRYQAEAANLHLLFDEPKVKLPVHYDRDAYREKDEGEIYKDDEEISRLRLLMLEKAAASDAPPLATRDAEAEAMERRRKAQAGNLVVRAPLVNTQPLYDSKIGQNYVAPDSVSNDLEARKKKYEEEQKAATSRPKPAAIATASASSGKQRPKLTGPPSTPEEIEEYKRQMLERYEQQQRENAEILRKKREAQASLRPQFT